MATAFLLYGANGFVGEAAARLAVKTGLQPILAGRNASQLEALANELALPYQVFALDDSTALDQALKQVSVVLHCAGPYLYTSEPMVNACLRNGVHYLDLTGEIPVYAAIAERDAEARARNVMLLPGAGFDVVPTDCLALYLKQRLPSATRLTLAFRTQGPAGLPPGTQRTMIELIPLAKTYTNVHKANLMFGSCFNEHCRETRSYALSTGVTSGRACRSPELCGQFKS